MLACVASKWRRLSPNDFETKANVMKGDVRGYCDRDVAFVRSPLRELEGGSYALPFLAKRYSSVLQYSFTVL